MATTTPNFGWAVPTSTDLVKDGAVAIETLGDAIDASLVDLKGGTTGQVLKKASGTDMDFTWSADLAGKVLQVVQDTISTGESTTASSYQNTNLSLSITPTATTSKILAIASVGTAILRANSDVSSMFINLVRTSTQLAEKIFYLEYNTSATETGLLMKGDLDLIYLDSPNTTSATTYKVQFKSPDGVTLAIISPDSGFSSLTLIEIGA
jgi:hypothetical protein